MSMATQRVSKILMGLAQAQLTLDELRDLNKAIVSQIRARNADDTRSQMANFHVDQYVKFHAKRRMWFGRITACNMKSASIQCPGMRWTVHPSYLTPMTQQEIDQFTGGAIPGSIPGTRSSVPGERVSIGSNDVGQVGDVLG
jgi:hypothetical protein